MQGRKRNTLGNNWAKTNRKPDWNNGDDWTESSDSYRRFTRQALRWNPPGARSWGRPREIWKRFLKKNKTENMWQTDGRPWPKERKVENACLWFVFWPEWRTLTMSLMVIFPMPCCFALSFKGGPQLLITLGNHHTIWTTKRTINERRSFDIRRSMLTISRRETLKIKV